MKFIEIFILFLSQFLCNGLCIIFDTNLGKIEGIISKSQNGRPFSNFRGIPYGRPPVGSLRFKRPEPAEPWFGTFHANSSKECVQYDAFYQKAVVGSEDCLMLNIYSPVTTKDDKTLYPVMFFIHGGGFFLGSGSEQFYGAERFMDYDVILITVNYRLGPLGFLSTSNDDMPGNLGLWDQTLALQWVQKNIKDFGGDPNKVTIFGESAGSMSVIFHYLSPQSKNLFQSAIAQSGVASSIFLKLDKNPIYYTRSLAANVGCNPETTTSELLTCLQETDAVKITMESNMFNQIDFNPVLFKPVIDDFTSDPFIPNDPWEMIESGNFNDVPLIIGNNYDEGLMTAINYYNKETKVKELQERWDNEVGPLYIFAREKDEIDKEVLELVQEVNKFAFPNEGGPTVDNIMKGFKDIISDVVFNGVGTITARKIAEKSKSGVYEYLYKHVGSLGFVELMNMPTWKLLLKSAGQFVGLNLFTPIHGVGHADELFMMFKLGFVPMESVYNDEDKATSKNILTMWTNFARTGNPTPNSQIWERLSKESQKRLEIGSGTLEMALDETLEKRIQFWTKIWERLPTNQRLNTSKTWKNPMLYRSPAKQTHKEQKEEL